jgi:hypothetical protein
VQVFEWFHQFKEEKDKSTGKVNPVHNQVQCHEEVSSA